MKFTRKCTVLAVVVSALVVTVLAAMTVTAALSDCQVRVLNQGDQWQVACLPGDNAYHIEYLKGDMFVTVEARFLDDHQDVVHTVTHTLVENSRMTALRTFEAGKVAKGVKASAIRFECDSGQARVSFGPANALSEN